MKKLITIGIPTYKRPNLIKRCLENLIKKKNSFLIIVSVDGVDETYKSYKKLEKNFKRFKNIKFIFHKKNIGSLKNFYFLRDACKTKYFMWLADDDVIKIETINKLYELLSKNKHACTAVPYWELHNGKKKKLIEPFFFDSNSTTLRVIKYLYENDDAFFYGLHKIKYLKNCKFQSYFWPNTNVLSNWCYVFQMDLILQGKILFLNNKKYRWINNDYGIKYYDKGSKNIFFKSFAYLLRKINIYLYYMVKFIKWKKINIFLIVLIIFPLFLIRDLTVREPAYQKVQF
jgi:glycosyltransferase involved in cell wall biosynthesis